MRFAHQGQYCKHIVGDRGVDAPQIYGVPSAVFLGVVPGQEEISDAACLAAILPSDPEQSFESEPGGLLIIRGEIQFPTSLRGDDPLRISQDPRLDSVARVPPWQRGHYALALRSASESFHRSTDSKSRCQ